MYKFVQSYLSSTLRLLAPLFLLRVQRRTCCWLWRLSQTNHLGFEREISQTECYARHWPTGQGWRHGPKEERAKEKSKSRSRHLYRGFTRGSQIWKNSYWALCCKTAYIHTYKYMRNIIKHDYEIQWTNEHSSL